tara:strand:+ start:3349 stop:3531 length:183 start_codon:yes stop_codon:yes gene_type:complete
MPQTPPRSKYAQTIAKCPLRSGMTGTGGQCLLRAENVMRQKLAGRRVTKRVTGLAKNVCR